MRFFVKYDCSLHRYTVHDSFAGDQIIGVQGSAISARDQAKAQEASWHRHANQCTGQVKELPVEYSWVA